MASLRSCVEDIEFGFVGVESRAVSSPVVCRRHCRKRGQFAGDADLEILDHFFQPVPVVGEILLDFQRARCPPS